MKPRILQLITDLQSGGAPHIVRDLATGLDPGQFDIHVSCLGPPGPVAKQLQKCKIPTHCLNATSPYDLKVFYRLAKLIQTVRPDILHTHLVHANIAGRFIGRMMNVPHIIATIHTAEQNKKWHLTAEAVTWHLSDLTVSVSPSVYRHTHRHSHVPTAHLRTITNGIDIDRFANAKPANLTELNLSPDKTTLIFVGRLDPVKNIDLIIRTTAQLHKEHNLQLLILGDGPERNKLETLTQKLNINNITKFAGMRPDPERCMKAADIMVIPSKWEGLSTTTLEAMAAGIPVIAANAPGLNDIITHNKTGILCEPDAPDSISHSVESLMTKPELVGKMTDNAFKHVKENYARERMINSYTDLYRELLGIV